MRSYVLCAALCASACAQVAPPKAEGIPPRTAPADYQAHAPAGPLTIAAEFTGHSVATQESILNTEDYVAVEVAIYGPNQTPIKISRDDFSLRINGKKTTLPSQPYGLVVKTLKDPELEPTKSENEASKTAISTGGRSTAGETPPPYRVPDSLRHEYSIRLLKLSLPEGDRILPQAGLIYFSYHGKTEKLQSIELIYTGAAGSATLEMQP